MIRDFKKGMHNFAELVAVIVNSALLLLVYVVAVGPTSLVARLAGKKFLDTSKKESYWVKLDLKKRPIKEYYRQF